MYNPAEPNSFNELHARERRLKKKRKQQIIDLAMESVLRKKVNHNHSDNGSRSSNDSDEHSPKLIRRQGSNLPPGTDQFGRTTVPIHPVVQISGFKVTDESVSDIKQQVSRYGKIIALQRGKSEISFQIENLKEAEKIVLKLNGRKYYGKEISAKLI